MRMTKFAAAAALSASMFAATAVPAQAKTVSAGTTWAKAKTVKKGTTTVKMKDNVRGYVKFKATATKTYKFKFNKLRCSGSKQNVYAWGYLSSGKEYDRLLFKQNGKQTNSFYVTTTANWSRYPSKTTTSSTYLPSRTVSVKLKKNQTVVIYFFASSAGKTVYYNLNIK